MIGVEQKNTIVICRRVVATEFMFCNVAFFNFLDFWPPLLSRNIYYLNEVDGQLVMGTIISDASVAIISFSEDVNVRGNSTVYTYRGQI